MIQTFGNKGRNIFGNDKENRWKMYQEFQKNYPYLCEINSINDETEIKEEVVDAAMLISPWRLDFMAKLILADGYFRLYDEKKAMLLYKKHLLAFSDGILIEKGQSEKRGLKKYCSVYFHILDLVKEKESLLVEDWPNIPVDSNYLPLDGAHRISAAIYFGKQVKLYHIDFVAPEYGRYDYSFFRNQCLDEVYILEMVYRYIQIRKCELYIVNDMREKDIQRIYEQYAPVYIKDWKQSYVIVVDSEWTEIRNANCKRKSKISPQLHLADKKQMMEFLQGIESELLKEKVSNRLRRSLIRGVRFLRMFIIRAKEIWRVDDEGK